MYSADLCHSSTCRFLLMGVSQPVCIPLICVTALYVIFSSIAVAPAIHVRARTRTDTQVSLVRLGKRTLLVEVRDSLLFLAFLFNGCILPVCMTQIYVTALPFIFGSTAVTLPTHMYARTHTDTLVSCWVGLLPVCIQQMHVSALFLPFSAE